MKRTVKNCIFLALAISASIAKEWFLNFYDCFRGIANSSFFCTFLFLSFSPLLFAVLFAKVTQLLQSMLLAVIAFTFQYESVSVLLKSYDRYECDMLLKTLVSTFIQFLSNHFAVVMYLQLLYSPQKDIH